MAKALVFLVNPLHTVDLGKRLVVLRNAHAPCKLARMRSIEIHACGSAQFTH